MSDKPGAVSTIKELVKRCRVQSGEEGDVDEAEPDYARKLYGDVAYGARVTVLWDGRYEGWERDWDEAPTYEDSGYIVGLPGIEERDASMGAVIHVPQPNNEGGKDAADPVWITLHDLLLLPDVLEVTVATPEQQSP